MDNIFSFSNSDFEYLDASRAVEVIQKLLWAEAFRLGVPYNFINISLNINIADGGIDARINHDIQLQGNNNVIRSGLSCYQIKSGKTFSPWKESAIKFELFGSGQPEISNLNSGIKNCMDNNGTYIIVCTGIDLVDTQMNETKENLEYFLKEKCNYSSPKYEIWSINNLISFIEPFYPSLCLDIRGISDLKFQTHESWASNSDMMKNIYIGQREITLIDNIRKELMNDNDCATHIRILGEPGIGKTRIILEVTSRDDFKNQVIYTNASDFIQGNLFNFILRSDNNYNVCLVIDECDSSQKYYIWNLLQNRGKRIKLLTIYNDFKNDNDKRVYIIDKLDSVEIENIILSYGVPKDKALKFAYLCNGSPRVAHVIGNNLLNNPEDLMKNPDYVDVWNRFINDPGTNDKENKTILLILEYLCLFKKWGYNDNSDDFDILLKIIQKADSSITKDRFIIVIDSLKNRKILQGEYVLYITPKLLHIWLWNGFWNKRKEHFSKDEIIQDLNESLLDNFYSMFEYAKNSETSTMVKELLSEKGPFNKDEFLKTRIGANFFLELAKVNPKDSLATLIRIFKNKSVNDLLNFKEGRREVITILEYTGQFKELFKDSILILLRFALAENEGYSNNASGVFTDFFSMGIGKLATTELSPLDRIKILNEIAKCKEKGIKNLVIKAIASALSEKMFRSVGLEGASLFEEPQGWIPSTYSEIIDAKREYWELLFSEYDNYSLQEKSIVYEIINDSLYYIGKEKELTDLVINTLKKIINEDDSIKEKLLNNIVRTSKWINQDDPSEMGKKWEDLCEYLEKGDFNYQMKRFVSFNILEDEYDENGNRISKLDDKLKELSKIYIFEKKYLDNQLDWLFTKKAINSFQFGYFLSKLDEKYLIFNNLLEKLENIQGDFSLSLISGYLRGVFERDIKKRDSIIIEMIKDNNKIKWISEIICHSGLTDDMILLMIELLLDDKIKIKDFEYIRFGSVLQNISEEILSKLIETLVLKNNITSYSLCLNFISFYCEKVNANFSIPKELYIKILVNVINIDIHDKDYFYQLDDLYFEELSKKFIQIYPDEYYLITNKLIETFGLEKSITEHPHSHAINVLEDIIQKRPAELWRIIVKYLGPPIDKRAFKLRNWLRGDKFFKQFNDKSKPAIEYIPIEEIYKWIDSDPEVRAWHFASFVPNKLFKKDDEICFAREILVKYGNEDKVKRNLRANFMTEGWTGPGSLHYEIKKQELIEFKKNENNSNVINWIDEFITILDANIKREKIEEERLDR